MAVAFFHPTFASDPYFNMACDEWLMARVVRQPGLAFLRMYSWQIGTITIGYHQKPESAVDFSKLGGTPIIRRITGGRALYHDPGELTYSIVVGNTGESSGRLSGSISQTSAALADALTRFLAVQGIAAAYERQSAKENATPAFFQKAPCFASVAKYEVVADGAKIIASAQKRLGNVLLQHGSIKLHGVAQHPALNVDMSSRAEALPVLTKERFLRAAELFRETMSDSLTIPFADSGAPELVREFTRYAGEVKKNPTSMRDPVKQIFGASSL